MNNVSYGTSSATISAMAGAMLWGAVGMTAVSSHLSTEQVHAIYSAAAYTANPELHTAGVASPTWRVITESAAVALTPDSILLQASMAFTASLVDGMEPLGSQFAAVLEDNFWDLVL